MSGNKLFFFKPNKQGIPGLFESQMDEADYVKGRLSQAKDYVILDNGLRLPVHLFDTKSLRARYRSIVEMVKLRLKDLTTKIIKNYTRESVLTVYSRYVDQIEVTKLVRMSNDVIAHQYLTETYRRAGYPSVTIRILDTEEYKTEICINGLLVQTVTH